MRQYVEICFALTEFRKGDIFAPAGFLRQQYRYGPRRLEPRVQGRGGYQGGGSASGQIMKISARIMRSPEWMNCEPDPHYFPVCGSQYLLFLEPLLFAEGEKSGYNAAYLDYIRNGKLDLQAPGKPAAVVTGTKVVLESKDNIGIWAVESIGKGSPRRYRNGFAGTMATNGF